MSSPEAHGVAQALPDDLLATLLAEFARTPISAAALSGSFTRGDADAYSDVDLRLYSDLPLDDIEPERLLYRSGRLISISLHTFRGEARQLADPPAAVFAVAPIRELRPLLDRDGALARLQRSARAFAWDRIASEADGYAARTLYLQAEVVQKALSGLASGHAARLALTTAELVQELTLAVAVSRRLLVASDRGYFHQVYGAVGERSVWARHHRLAAGTREPSVGESTTRSRGLAALQLYRETAALLDVLLTPDQKSVVAEVVRRIEWATLP
jgi:hypothetical protein